MRARYYIPLALLLVLASLASGQTVFGVEPPSGDAADYGITYTQPITGERRWYASHIRHYPPGSNDWRHNLYVSTYNYEGWPNDPAMPDEWSLHVPQANVPIICCWSGEDTPYPLPEDHVILNTWTEKPPTEPGVNFPMEMNATYKVAVYSGEPGTSAIVSNIHTRHPDESSDVTMGHHSFDVYFTAIENAEPTARPTPTPAPTWTPGPTFTATPTMTPMVTETPVNAEEMIRESAWNHLYPDGVNYNPTAAFQAVARERGHGAPVTQEFDVSGNYRVQGFVMKILYSRIGDWQNVSEVEW